MYPALSVAEVLAADGDEVSFIGTPTGVEARLATGAGLPFRGLSAAGFDRSRPATLVTSSLRVLASAVRAWGWFGKERPDVVMGFGGYVSIPVGLAASWRGIPLVLHEQNSVPGLANRFLSRHAASVCVTYESSARYLAKAKRVEVTGNPVRAEVLAAERSRARDALGIAEDALMVLAFGGSQGARHINTALVHSRAAVLDRPDVIMVHVAGPLEREATAEALEAAGGDGGGRWRVLGYLDDMPSWLAAADLVIARAGATSIAEITARGIPAVLVPFPYATDDHQTRNAAAVREAGGAVVVSDSELDGPAFVTELERLLGDAGLRATMAAASRSVGRPQAARLVAEQARDAATRRDAGDEGGRGRALS